MSVNYKIIGNRIQSLRKSRCHTQEQMAEYVDISTGYLSQVESQSKPQPISLDLLFRMADLLEVEPKQLLEFEK